MKVLNELSVKDLRLNKKRSIVIIIGIILSTALICGVAGLITSFQKTFVETAKNSQGNYHAIFYNVPKDELKYIEENRSIEDYYLSEELGYSYLTNGKTSTGEEEKPIVNVISMNNKFLNNMAINVREGRLPENDGELAISTRINEKFKTNYKVGDTITLNVGELKGTLENQNANYYDEEQIKKTDGAEQKTENEIVNVTSKIYKIVGIIERPTTTIEPYEADWFTVITKMQTINKKANIAVLYTKPNDYVKNTESINQMVTAKSGTKENDFNRVNGLDKTYKSYKYQIKINKELLAYQGASLDDDTLRTIYGLGAFIMGIVLVSSVFVIRNGFAISITERLKQYGMLSSIGATKKQIKKSVYFEGFILGIIGIPLGILSGIFAIYILVNVVNYILKDYVSRGTLLTYGMSWSAIVISIIVSVVTIWLSFRRSAKKASKITPIEAIRSSEDVKLKAKKIKCPKIITKIFKTGGEIAYKNLKRSKKKYRTTVISIIVSIVIFISISSFIQYGFKMSEAYYTEMNYNYMVFMQENEDNKEELKKYKILEDISKLPDAGEYSINKSNVLTMNMDEKHKAELTEYGKEIKERFYNEENGVRIDEINVISLSKEAYERYVSKLGGDYEKYKNGAILIDKNINTNNDGKKIQGNIYTWKKGDIITGKINDTQCNIEILAKTEEIPAGVNILYNPDAFIIVSEDFINKVGYKSIALYSNSNDAYKLDEEIKQYKQENNITDNTIQTFNMEESARAENAIVLVISIFLYGFIGVITLIGITNIFNTITTNMNLRKKEFAMLKSIGMTKKEFNRMIRLESIFYGLKSLIIGIPIGIILSYGMYTVFRNNMEMEYILPYKSIVISIVFVAVIIGIIMKYSMSKINKQNVIETIRNDNI